MLLEMELLGKGFSSLKLAVVQEKNETILQRRESRILKNLCVTAGNLVVV